MTAPRPTPRRRMHRLAALVALPYLAIVGFLGGCQRHLIYFPHKAAETELRAQAAATGLKPWVAADGQLIGWRGETATGATPPAARLLVVHGNAGSAVHRGYFVHAFAAVANGTCWEVSLLEYSGYGARTGTPGERSLADAAAGALAQLQREDTRPIYLLGESLGSGVACGLAAAFPNAVRGLVLITPFTSLTEVGAQHYPYLPVRLLLRDRYDNVAALQRFAGPVAIVVAGRDEVVPAELGRNLHAGYAGPKRLWEHPGAGHNLLDYRPGADWTTEVSDFLLPR